MRVSSAVNLLFAVAAAHPTEKRTLLDVKLDYATVVGSSFFGIDSWKGIPYAQPPVGPLRLKPPQPITSNLGTVWTIGTPRACPQFSTSTNTNSLPEDLITDLLDSPLGQILTDAGEDCLTINVQRPSSATANSSLPVVFWIFGGGFELGSTQQYDGTPLVSQSVTEMKDIIYVSVNYRLGGFGFLAGSEILKDGSSNLGLLDQRLGLQWVADNIAKFGGDPSKVTIWGESAGAISVFDQMALYNGNNTYKGKPLFRGAIMDSGSIVPAYPVDGVKGNQIYNAVVAAAGCGSSSDSLECLRKVPYETFLQATTSVPGILGYHSVAESYLPRPDGIVLTDSPELIAESGHYTQIPFIVGDQEDEGTLFALSQSNLSTTADLVDYFKTIFFPSASTEQIEDLVNIYSANPADGSPYNTGTSNEIYPQFKRLAAILGDITFTITRRIFLNIASDVYSQVPSWSYLASYDYGASVLGTYHGSDILKIFGNTPDFPSQSIRSYYISFINSLDPNVDNGGLTQWPQWSEGQELLHFLNTSNGLIRDDFRNESYTFLATTQPPLRI